MRSKNIQNIPKDNNRGVVRRSKTRFGKGSAVAFAVVAGLAGVALSAYRTLPGPLCFLSSVQDGYYTESSGECLNAMFEKAVFAQDSRAVWGIRNTAEWAGHPLKNPGYMTDEQVQMMLNGPKLH